MTGRVSASLHPAAYDLPLGPTGVPMTRLVPLLWIATVALASTAYAEPTKVALAIEGDSSAKGLRKAVVNAFGAEDDVQFVSAQKMTRAIEQLGIGEVHTP